MVNLKKHLDMLGMRVKDRVTGFEGIVSSVMFDLYGCIQAIVTPVVGADGKVSDSHYFDVNRLEITSTEPVMRRPAFDWSPEDISNGEQGCADRPKMVKV